MIQQDKLDEQKMFNSFREVIEHLSELSWAERVRVLNAVMSFHGMVWRIPIESKPYPDHD